MGGDGGKIGGGGGGGDGRGGTHLAENKRFFFSTTKLIIMILSFLHVFCTMLKKYSAVALCMSSKAASPDYIDTPLLSS